MKIVFMGTPDFAIPSLKKIIESKHELVAIVTTPDKERGRGRKVTYTAVKQFALENNIPVLQPVKLKDEDFIEQLKSFYPDLFVVVAFRILPREVFSIPPRGSFNLHGSLLPSYRGAAPIQWALIEGQKETGVTTFALDDKVDTGNIYIQEKIEIFEDDDFGALHDRMSLMGAEVVLKTIDLIESGNYKLQPQNDKLASPAPKITKETAKIDWNKSAIEIQNLVRGLSPYPGAYFYHNDKQIKVYKTRVHDLSELLPGEIRQTKKELFIGSGNGTIQILELQLEGKKRLSAEEFLRGYTFE